MIAGRPRQQDRRGPLAPGPDQDPALILLGLIGVLDQLEPEPPHIEVDGLVIVADDERDMRQTLVIFAFLAER